MQTITITCLGEFEVALAGQRIPHFPTDKARALLVYLALEPDHPHTRQALTGLLWPDQPQAKAFANLRTTLRRLRQTLDEAIPGITGEALILTRQTIQVRPDAVSVDVHAMDSLMSACIGHAHADLTTCDACLTRLAQVVALYRGDLLAGFSLPDAPPFEEWLVIRREMAQQQVLTALHVLAEAHLRQGQYDQALAYATRQLNLDPYREAACRQAMRALASTGQRAAALAQFDRCAEALRSELGIAPDQETVEVAEQIRSQRFRPQSQASSRPDHPELSAAATTPLPAYVSPFVGRERNVAELITLLEQPGMRLLTVVGTGGMGKTRLAVEVARVRQNDYRDGVIFTPLASVSHPTAILTALATALGLSEQGADPRRAVTQALRHRHTLIVLDNFEHVLDGVGLLVELLEAAPTIQVIVTSRERLNVRGEHVYQVAGMEYDLMVGLAAAAALPAVRLFTQSACRLEPDFELNEANFAQVLRICDLVQGMPLGLELAAVWVEALGVEEIAAEIERSADFLAYDWRDVPERQRSLRAVFDWSWRLLSDDEQQAFGQLSVFRGGFTREAAQAVVGASLRVLTGLVRKSLLSRSESGATGFRFEMHELVRQFAVEQNAAAGAREAVAARHASYYAALLKQHEKALASADQAIALKVIDTEIENIRAVWRWLVGHGQVQGIADALDGLSLYCELRGLRQEGEYALRDAFEELTRQSEGALSDTTRLTRSRLLAWRGRFAQFLGRYGYSDELLAQSLALGQGVDDGRVAAFCRASQGINAGVRGEYTESCRLEQEAIRLYREVGDLSGMADVFNRLGGNYYDMGEFAEARRCWQESYSLFRRVGDRSGMARGLNNLGEVARQQGDYPESRRQAEESLALLREIGHGWQSIHPLNNLGMLARIAGEFAEARRLHQECLAIAREIGDQRNIATTQLRLAVVAADMGEWQEAWGLHADSLNRYRQIAHLRGITACLTSMARLVAQRDDHGRALHLLEPSLEIAQVIGDRLAISQALSGWGWSAGMLCRETLARRALAAAFTTLMDIQALPYALEVLVMTAALLIRKRDDSARNGAVLHRTQHALNLLSMVQRHPAASETTRAWAARLDAELVTWTDANGRTTASAATPVIGIAQLAEMGKAAFEV